MKNLISLIIVLAAFTTSFSQNNLEFRIEHARRHITSTYGDNVFVKPKQLTKFGKNVALGTTEEMVWARGGVETYETTNRIDSISSSDSGDTQVVTIEGHTISGGELTFVTQTVTLTGQTPAVLATPLYRANRMYNSGSTDLAGTVYLYSGGTVTAGVPQTTAEIHLQTDGSNNQSLKAATAISKDDYWIITSGTFGVNRQQSRSVDFRIQVREYGKVFRTIFPVSAHSNSGTVQITFDPCLVVPKNSDVRVVAVSSGTDTQVEATLNGYLALISQ